LEEVVLESVHLPLDCDERTGQFQPFEVSATEKIARVPKEATSPLTGAATETGFLRIDLGV
jgi:hypothetical protein